MPAGVPLAAIVVTELAPPEVRMIWPPERSVAPAVSWVLDRSVGHSPLLAQAVGDDEAVIVIYTTSEDSLVVARLDRSGVAGAYQFDAVVPFAGFGINQVGLGPSGLATLSATPDASELQLSVFELP